MDRLPRYPTVWTAGSLLLGYDGSLYPSLRREPSVSRALGEALFGARWPQRPGWLSETIRDPDAYQAPRDVAWAGGAAILVSAACSEAVGDWDDDRFFLYSEETDFAARARRCGYRVLYVPTAQVRHEDGGSGRSPALGALLAVNRIRYYEKYHRRPATSFFRAAVALHYLLRSADPYQRVALKVVIRRSRWPDLPSSSAWIEDYNTRRRHSALAMMPPVDCEQALRPGRQPEMPALVCARIGRCSALSRSFLPGQRLRSGGTWQLPESTDRHDQPIQSVHAFRGTSAPIMTDLYVATETLRKQ